MTQCICELLQRHESWENQFSGPASTNHLSWGHSCCLLGSRSHSCPQDWLFCKCHLPSHCRSPTCPQGCSQQCWQLCCLSTGALMCSCWPRGALHIFCIPSSHLDHLFSAQVWQCLRGWNMQGQSRQLLSHMSQTHH